MSKCALFPFIRGNVLHFRKQVVFYSSMLGKAPTINPQPEPVEIKDEPIRRQTQSHAMRVYMENVNVYNKFMAEQRSDFEIGKRHLANMMGCDPEMFTQQDIDEAIEYLFPCGLFDKKAHPIMKPPEAVFRPKKEAEFDISGRPFHFLFYTVTPNYYQILHDIVNLMKELDRYEDQVISGKVKNHQNEKIMLESSVWVSPEKIEKICCERLSKKQYEYLTATLQRLASHPYAKRAEDFILKFRQFTTQTLKPFELLEPTLLEDGRKLIRSEWCKKKSTKAHVNVICPGTGKLSIDGKNIEYFTNIQSKEQILFPLVLSGMLNKVDIEAELVKDGKEIGDSAAAGAIRLGISRGLAYFVDSETREKMKLAGLLQREFRRKERKKPGQEGARRKFTWKKR